jgi:hypothetical protein
MVRRLDAEEGDTLFDLAIRNDKRVFANLLHDSRFPINNSDFNSLLAILTQARRRALLELCVKDAETAHQQLRLEPPGVPSEAASASQMGLPSASVSASSEQDPVECCVCMEEPRNCKLLPCNHAVICTTCAAQLVARGDACPVCRGRIRSWEEGEFPEAFAT